MSWHASNRLPVRRWPSHRASHFLRASVFIVSFLAFVLPSVVDAGGRGPPPPPPRINCYGHYDARTINCHYARCGGWGQAWPWMTLNNWQDYRCTQSLGRVYAATEPVACRSCACETQTIYGAPCKGPMCNQGTRTDTIGGYNPACSITTRMTTVPCTPIPTLPANTLTQGSYTQDSFPDLNGFKTLTVFGCGGIARSPGCNWQGLCTCRPNAAGYTWPKAAQWRCISNIPPAVSLYPPEGTGNSAGALSTSWVANDPWRPSVTVKFYQYVFGGYHSVIFDSFPLNYKPAAQYWPVLQLQYKVIRTDINTGTIIANNLPTPVCVNRQTTSYWWGCTITNWELPGVWNALVPDIPQPAEIPVNVYIGVQSEAGTSSWTLVGAFSFVPPDPYPWSIDSIRSQPVSGPYLSTAHAIGILDTSVAVSVSSTTKPLTVTTDKNTARLVFSIACTPQGVNAAEPTDEDFYGSINNPIVQINNTAGFQTPKYNIAFSTLPNVTEATCTISGLAINMKGLDPDNTYGGSTPSNDFVIGILRVGPQVISAPLDSPVGLPSDLQGPGGIARYFWTTKDSLYASWNGVFRGNAKVLSVLKTSASQFTTTGSSITGTVQHVVRVLLYLNTTSVDPIASYLASASVSLLPTLRQCINFHGANFTSGLHGCEVATTTLSGVVTSYQDTSTLTRTILNECNAAGVLYNCVDCFRCFIRTRITGYDAAANPVNATTYGIVYDASPPVIRSMLPVGKFIRAGLYWYGSLRDMNIDLDLAEPEAPLSSIPLDISVDGFTYTQGEQVPSFYQSYPQLSRLDAPTGTVAASATGWDGFTLHAQTYNVQIDPRSLDGQTATAAFKVRSDSTPPTFGVILPNHLVYNMATDGPLEMTTRNVVDRESGILDYYVLYLLGDNSHCAKSNFKWPLQSRHNWTRLATNRSEDGTMLPTQTFPLAINETFANTTTGYLYVGIAFINYAMTPYGAVQRSVTVACGWPIVLDNGYPSIYIESLEVESIMGFDSVAGTWVARRIAQIKWQTLHIYGEQSYNITLYNGNETIGMYTDITYKSASIFFNSSAPLLVSENFTAAISVSTFTKDTLPPKNVSVIINNDDPDLSTCAESVITFPLGMSAGPAVAQVDWTKCVSPIREIDQWVYWIMPYMSVIDSTLKNTTVAKNVTKIAVPIEVTHQMIYKVCVGALDSYGNGTYAFCTENTLVDLTPPEPSGSVRDVDVNLGLPVASAVNTTSLRFQWDPWVDAESGIANYTLTVNCSGSAATQSISIPAQATDYTLYLSDPTIWLSPFNATAVMPEGTKCVGILLATNNAGLNSEPFTSPGITSVARTPAAEQYLSVLDGTVMQTSNYTWHFFPLLPNVTAHLGWGSIVEYNKSSASISFAVALTNMLDATDIHSYYFQNSVDAVIPLPQQAAVYSASLSIYIGGERARTLMSADSIAVIEGGPVTLPTLTSLNNYCEVDLNTINEGAPGQALFVPTVNISTVSAFWPPFVDTFGIIDRLQLAFRQKTKPDQTSNWVDAVLPKNATGFEGRVTWIYGVPEVLWSQEMECVLQAIDIIGNVTTLIMPGYLTSYPWFNPTVVDLSNWALLGTPVSATDYDFYSDIAVTPNSTYSVGFAGFPDLILNDKVLATVQFSVGNAYSPNAPTVFDNLLPPTFMDVRKISLTSMNVADNIIPFRFFSIPNFILPENELVHACINVTNVASGNSTAACTDGIIYSPDAPVQGNVYIKTSNNYITTSTSIQISWSGFYARGWLDAEDLGIARFEWSVGTYVGWDDVVTRRSVSSTQQTAVAQDLDLVAGDEIYATVTAYSHAGVPISSYSSPAVIDWSAPVSKGGFTKIKNMRERDGTYTLDVSYDEFVDLESEVRVVYLILETEYGLEDVIPPTKAITPRYTYATGLHLASGTPYVLRLVAVNGAGMRQEISASVTPETAVRLLYLYDYRAGGTWTAVANSSTSYTFSWVVSGSPLYFEVAAGTIPHQHDVMGWTRVDGLSRNFTLDLTAFPINDGEILYATIHAFNQAGLLADVAVTSGLTMDSSPPVLGRIVQGDTPFIHSPYANHFEFVQCSWTGFMDVHSEIVLYEACVDTNGNHTDLMASCSNLDWTPVDSSMTVQELALETHLEQGKHYYLKLRVTNAAGSPAIGVSPMFTADAERPVGQFITVGFPSKEAQRAGMNGGYFEQTIIQVEWQFAPPPISGIGQYIVGIYGQDGAIPVTTPAQIPGGLNRWTFSVDAKSLPEPLVEGVAYIAVARAVSGSGVIGDLVTEPFTIFTTAPSVTLPAVSFQNYANGTTSYFNDTTNTTEYTTTGNATIDVVVSNIGGSTQSALAPASYFVALGSYEYGTDIAMRTLNDTCGGSCDTTFTVPAKNYTLYWATVYSMDYAGLQSNPVSTSSFWDTGSPVGLLTNSVSWTITSVKPSAVDFNATAPTSIAVTGTGLSSLVASGYSGTITCNFEYPQSPGTVSSVPATLSTVDTVAQISCTPPSLQSSGLIPMNLTEGYVSLVIATGGSSTLAFNVFHKSSSNTAWGVGSQAVLGLSPFNNAYLPTPWSWHLTWPQELPSNDIAYYTVVGFGETYSTVLGIQNYSLFTISPTAPQAVNAQPGLFQWQVCSHPFLNVSSPSCIPSNTGLVDTMVASINPLVNTGYDDDIPTAVRITGAWADMAFDYESGGGYQSNASGIAANWTDSFVFANPSNKTINHFDVGAGYKPYRFDMNMSATGLSGTLGTATFMADLVPGVPFYVTLVVWDSAGLPSAYVSAPLILDTTAASLGTVFTGPVTSAVGRIYQSNNDTLQAHWKGFTETESLIIDYNYYICTSTLDCPYGPYSNGLHTRVQAANLSLADGSYHIAVEAQNAAGTFTQKVFSPAITIDRTGPVLSNIQFGDNATIASAVNKSFALDWSFEDAESPIVEYYVQLGTVPGGPQILPWTSVSTRTSLPLFGMELPHNHTIHALVSAKNAAGLWAKATTSVKVDLTAPNVTGMVRAFDGAQYYAGVGQVDANATWSGAFQDDESPIVEYQYAIGQEDDPEKYQTYASVGLSTAVPPGVTFTVSNGDKVIISVRAWNQAGLSSVASSQPVLFSDSTPSSFTVDILDNLWQPVTAIYEGANYIKSAERLDMRLTNLFDNNSGLSRIQMRLIQNPSQILFDWFTMRYEPVVRLAYRDAPTGVPLRIEIKAFNNLDLTSSASSRPFVILPGRPTPPAVTLQWLPGTPPSVQVGLPCPELTVATGPLFYSLGVFSSAAGNKFDVRPLLPITLPADCTTVVVNVPVPLNMTTQGRNFTAVLVTKNILNATSPITALLPAP